MASSQIPWPTPMRAIGAQNLLTMPGGVSHSGYLHKKGGSQFSLMKWPLRFIILHKGCVYYFKSSTSPSPQGAFSLNGYNRVMRAAEETTANNVFPFKIVHFSKRHRTWYFSAACEDERKKWMVNLRKEIDFYHDRRDARVTSDSNTDLDGFYGSIEKPLEINYTPDTEDDYVVEDEEDEDEDYLKPDEGQSMTGHLMKPPPAYPPPPVPFLQQTDFPHRASPPPLAPTKNLPNPVSRKLAPPLPPPKLPKPDNLVEKDMVNKGPPPPVPLAHLKQKPSPEPHPRLPKSPIPCTAPPILKKKVSTTLGALTETKPPVPIQGPRTLPICVNLEKNLSLVVGPKPSMIPLKPEKKPLEELAKPAMYRPSLVPKPSPSNTNTRGPFQRSSPDGQSFRSSVDEVPAHLRKEAPKHEDDSDDEYENVQLPDSVFIKTTETSSVEKLFKETCRSPQDGLYCIRNSGTKTSKVLVVWDVGLNKARNYRLFEEDSRIFLEAENIPQYAGPLGTSQLPPSLQSIVAPTEPLLCKFADGGQKKRQSQGKYTGQNGRAWSRDPEAGMITYDPTTAAMQNGYYASPYSIANRMIAQTPMSPYISPVSAYQVQNPSWVSHQPYLVQHPGAVISPSMDHTMSLQPTPIMSPLTQQMSHLSLGSAGTFMPASTALQGAYLPQYTHVQTTAVQLEESSGQPQEPSSGHSSYTYQQAK